MTSTTVSKLDRSALLGILAQQSDDVLAELMGKVAQAAIDAQFDEFIGAEQYERSADRNVSMGLRPRSFRNPMLQLRVG
jgi:transposase-like protein